MLIGPDKCPRTFLLAYLQGLLLCISPDQNAKPGFHENKSSAITKLLKLNQIHFF